MTPPQLSGHRAKVAVERVLRVLGVGLLFATFGLGSVVLSGLVLPIFNLVQRGGESELRAQAWIQRLFSAFMTAGTVIGIYSVRYRGAERLQGGPNLVIANHPTLLDVVVLGALLPQCDCVVKGDAWRNFFLRGIVVAAGYIANFDGPDLVKECSARLKAGRTVVLFPEGTRSPESSLGPFGRGPAHIALETGCRILPVVVRCDPPALMKGQPWYALPNARLCFEVEVGEAMYAKDIVDSGATRAVAARHLTEAMRSYFEARSGYRVV